jgi:hypothetical protein
VVDDPTPPRIQNISDVEGNSPDVEGNSPNTYGVDDPASGNEIVSLTEGSDPSSDGSAKMVFSSGIFGFVYPLDKGNWHWSVIQNNQALRHGIAYSKDQAERICERLAPEYQKPLTEP